MEKTLRVNTGKIKVGRALVRLRILENIHVVFAGRELEQLNLLLSVLGGFIKNEVAFQES